MFFCWISYARLGTILILPCSQIVYSVYIYIYLIKIFDCPKTIFFCLCLGSEPLARPSLLVIQMPSETGQKHTFQYTFLSPPPRSSSMFPVWASRRLSGVRSSKRSPDASFGSSFVRFHRQVPKRRRSRPNTLWSFHGSPNRRVTGTGPVKWFGSGPVQRSFWRTGVYLWGGKGGWPLDCIGSKTKTMWKDEES